MPKLQSHFNWTSNRIWLDTVQVLRFEFNAVYSDVYKRILTDWLIVNTNGDTLLMQGYAIVPLFVK